jgi:hypothetical protein
MALGTHPLPYSFGDPVSHARHHDQNILEHLAPQRIFARRQPSWSRYLVGFSAIYAGAMVFRYILTMIFLPEMRWLGGTIPVFFHFVLAAFLFTWGRFHAQPPTFARGSDPC